MSISTLISILLTGFLFLCLYQCIRKFISLEVESTDQKSKELDSRIVRNWLEIHKYRNDNSANVDNLAQSFDDMEQLHSEFLCLRENNKTETSRRVFLHEVKTTPSKLR